MSASLDAGGPRTLAALAAQLAPELDARCSGDASVVVRDVRHDSRRVCAGDLFVARPGTKRDGAEFIADAVARGAAAVLVETGGTAADLSVPVPVLSVTNLRRSAALIAELLHGQPSRALSVVGVTGTNGKTTTVGLISAALESLGIAAGRAGTLGISFGEQTLDVGLTTPEADDLSRFAAQIVRAGATHLVMEVSSHALELDRVSALHFEVAAFSNLTQDHLDYHGTMAEYAAAKRRLFTELLPRSSVINVDDEFGAQLASETPGSVLRVSRTGKADVWVRSASSDARGILAEVCGPFGTVELRSRLVGDHNLDNLLLSLGVLHALGCDAARVAEALGAAKPVPGRLERCDSPEDDVVVLVDYAHTPDALERVLRACRPLTRGELICVFGCGGDRDPAKRPRMGQAVGALADRAIVTNDNPRSEDPVRIAAAIEPGLQQAGRPYRIELDRARAIERAVLEAKPGDVVLLAGKGHEPYQIIGSERRPFDDREEARRALGLRRAGRKH